MNSLRTISIVFAVLSAIPAVEAAANPQDDIRQQLLKLFPQADTDKDGVISDAEEAAVRRQILKRFSQADKDSDGVLSDAEMKAVLRQAANRAKRNTPNSGNSRTNRGEKKPNPAALLASLGLKSELNIEYKNLVHGDTDPTVPIELSKHLYQQAKTKGADVKLVEVTDAGHGFKPVNGSKTPPSLTWDEAQKLVIRQVIEWVNQK